MVLLVSRSHCIYVDIKFESVHGTAAASFLPLFFVFYFVPSAAASHCMRQFIFLIIIIIHILNCVCDIQWFVVCCVCCVSVRRFISFIL